MVARNLGIKFDTNLSFDPQIKALSSACFFTLWSLKQMLFLIPIEHRKTLVHALVTSRLDYTNSLYLGLPAGLIRRLQSIQNAAFHLVLKLPARQSVSFHLHSLHWVPVPKRVQLKALVFAFRAYNFKGPR